MKTRATKRRQPKRRTQQRRRARRGAAGGSSTDTRPGAVLGQPRPIWLQVERRRGSFAPL